MSFDLQTESNERKVDAFIRPAIVFNTRQDMRGHIVVDCIDKYGNALLGCYFIGPPGAAFNFAIPSGEQVIVIKSGLDGNNYIIGQAATTSQNVQPPTQARPTPTTSVTNYTTTHAGDYEVKVDVDARLNLNANNGATIDGRNINLQLHDGVLRIAQGGVDGRSDELLLNANETIAVLLGQYEKLLLELVRMREAIRDANEYTEGLRNTLFNLGITQSASPITGSVLSTAIQANTDAFNFISLEEADVLTENYDTFNEKLDASRNKNITVPLGSPEISIDDATEANALGES